MSAVPDMPEASASRLRQNPSQRLAERAYETLRRMAMTYALTPGARLSEIALARMLDVSRTPLREAMNRLASEGLLVSDGGRGFFARGLEASEVLALYETRLGLEGYMAALACARADATGLAELEAYLDRSIAAQESAPVEELLGFDEGFHTRVAALTGNPELMRMLGNINARTHFFRWVDMNGRRDKTQAEHRGVLEAMKAGEPDRARAIMEGHIRQRMDQIVDVVREANARLLRGAGMRSVAFPVGDTGPASAMR